VAKARNTGKRAITALTIEMAKPRFVASVRDDVNVVSSFKGIYARVARKLKVSPSMVSRVANKLRSSPKIKKALLAEVDAIKQKLDAVT
jgi:DhnA family fructose-bisphosphate aldolase class Ia